MAVRTVKLFARLLEKNLLNGRRGRKGKDLMAAVEAGESRSVLEEVYRMIRGGDGFGRLWAYLCQSGNRFNVTSNQ
jgi:hypothetical protein